MKLNLDVIDTTEYTYKDFKTKFNVTPIFEIEMDNFVKSIIDKNDITKEKKYKEVADDYRRFYDKMVEYIKNNPKEKDDRVSVRFVNDKMGYGLFTKKPFTYGEVLGVFSGQLQESDDTDYMWMYPTLIDKSKDWDLGVDAKYRGNYLRFVNHNEDRQNVDV